MTIKKIGIVGCGAMGTEIARAIQEKIIPAELTAVCDINKDRLSSFLKNITLKPVTTSIQKLVLMSDIVIESAGIPAVKDVVTACIKEKKKLVIMSTGYFLNDPDLLVQAKKKGCEIIIPSGALAGMDAVKAASIAGIESATLTTTKPPAGLKGAPYFNDHPINLDAINQPTVIFEGNALDAIKGFPANINVSAILSIMSIGPNRTRVKIIADPHAAKNIHEITVTGRSGIITARTENVPSPTNPKTSYLAILSAISTLRNLCQN